jgi:serine/threonine protein kinase
MPLAGEKWDGQVGQVGRNVKKSQLGARLTRTFRFGRQVWKAEADDLTGHQGMTRLVAVKTVKEGASDREKEDLVRELEIMQRVGSHPNVVTLLGCCTEQGESDSQFS